MSAPSEIQRGEVGTPFRQRDHTRVRDMLAPCETQRGEVGAPFRQQHDHTRVRDMSAVTEIQRGEVGTPLSVRSQPDDLYRVHHNGPPALPSSAGTLCALRLATSGLPKIALPSSTAQADP